MTIPRWSRRFPSIGLLLLAAMASSQIAVAQRTVVKSGDSGQIRLPIAAYAASTQALAAVSVSVTAPAYFSSFVSPASATIARGSTTTFVVDYVIGSTTTSGNFDVLLNVSASPESIVIPNTFPPSATLPFTIANSSPTCSFISPFGVGLTDVIASTTTPIVSCTSPYSAICSINVYGPSAVLVSSAVFSSASDALSGPLISLSTGLYSFTAADCVGNSNTSTFTITLSTVNQFSIAITSGMTRIFSSGTIDSQTVRTGSMTMVVETMYPPCAAGDQSCIDTACKEMTTSCSTTGCMTSCSGGFCSLSSRCDYSSIQNSTFTVFSSTINTVEIEIQTTLSLYTSTNALMAVAVASGTGWSGGPGWTIAFGTITVPEAGQRMTILSPDSIVQLASYIQSVSLPVKSIQGALLAARLNQILAQVGNAYEAHGSEFVFNSTTTISFTTAAPVGVTVDTQTLRIHYFDGVQWSSSEVTNQYINVDAQNIITATGTVYRSGTYALFFQGHDSSAPVTSFSVQGSSFVFNGLLFISTDSTLSLPATDPLVNGFASQVQSTHYRLDPTSPGQEFQLFTSSFVRPLGPHVLEYRSIDWSGNLESIKTTTFVVTGVSAFTNTSDQRVTGRLLAGSTDTGAQFEIESTGDYAQTLLISSANKNPLFSITWTPAIGIGTGDPQARLDISSGSIALQLRSGNSTNSLTSSQLVFARNGEAAYPHLIRSQHGANAGDNKLEFLVWTPDSGSTTTLANMTVLALQGISGGSGASAHIRPSGTPDVELEVSNGSSTGGGTMQRLQVLNPSSRRFKSDVRYLDEQTENAALKATANLKHVHFQYKTPFSEGGQPLSSIAEVHRGLVYEDVPSQLRDGRGGIDSAERLAQLEMALRAAIRRLEALQSTYESLKEPR